MSFWWRTFGVMAAVAAGFGAFTVLGPTGCNPEDHWYCRLEQPPACEGYGTEAECLTHDGCKFDGMCSDRTCFEMSDEQACRTAQYCRWRSTFCVGYSAANCIARDTSADCALLDYCVWVPGCSGTQAVPDCDVLNYREDCEALPGCVWTERSNG